MSHSTIREVANVFLKHEASYCSNGPIALSDDLLQAIANDLMALRDQADQAAPRSAYLPWARGYDFRWWHGFKEAGAANVYNAVYMLDEKPFAYLPHHEANQIQYFMRRFRNSGGWKLIYPWKS